MIDPAINFGLRLRLELAPLLLRALFALWEVTPALPPLPSAVDLAHKPLLQSDVALKLDFEIESSNFQSH